MYLDVLVMAGKNITIGCLIALISGVGIGSFTETGSDANEPLAYDHPIAPMSRDDIVKKIDVVARQHGVDAALMQKIVKCESNYNQHAIGDSGKSLGLVQIHMPAHTNISVEAAQDPDFALEFLASKLKEGQGAMWTCYHLMTAPAAEVAQTEGVAAVLLPEAQITESAETAKPTEPAN